MSEITITKTYDSGRIPKILISKKEMYLDLVKRKNRIILMNKKIEKGIRILCFVWNDKTVSPKTDRFLILAYEIIGTTFYIAFKTSKKKTYHAMG